jgi:hypothetical protein
MAAALLPRALRRVSQVPGFRRQWPGVFGSEADARVSVLQFNALADALATTASFPLVDPACLAWSHRLPLLLEEITRHQPDIVCLQVRTATAPRLASPSVPPCTPGRPDD